MDKPTMKTKTITTKKPTIDDVFELYRIGVQQGFVMDYIGSILPPPFPPRADWITRLGIELGLEREEVEYDNGY